METAKRPYSHIAIATTGPSTYLVRPHQPITIEAVPAIYFSILGLVAVFDMLCPVQSAAVAAALLPVEPRYLSIPYIRYRLLLFLAANVVLVVLAIAIFFRGLGNPTKEAIKRMSWWLLLFGNVIAVVIWLGPLLISSNPDTYMGNNILYFLTTICCFAGVHIILQLNILKLKLMMGRVW